ncbi:MAG: NADH-quinone oxidoreductase subunit NuoF [Bacillota bacterium]|nr:NADH-quinone oxidoreductase subunit NuoF [Bacillota bacterium]
MKVVVGAGSCGYAAGAQKIVDRLTALGIESTLTGCIGLCYLEPIMDVYRNGELYRYTRVRPEDVESCIQNLDESHKISAADEIVLEKQQRVVLRNCGVINPESLEDYLAVGGYQALEKCRTMHPQDVIAEIKASGLRGRGGAGFPTWFKWDAALKNQGSSKAFVCNADEGDPGAFMDRSVLEGDPHSLIEGMLIGAYAIGAKEAIVYVRAEYPLAIKRLQNAIDQARDAGYFGDVGFRIKAGAGAFVCGEETALIASLEGERGMPRLKPPFPAQKGYFGEPTNINNVETLANIPFILLQGAQAFRSYGTEQSAGTKVFALTGKIAKGGLVEVPMGTKLRDVIFETGGGIQGGARFKAVQMGGPSGGCIPIELLDTPVDYENIMKTGSIIGSGGMVVMDDSTCMVEMARFFLDFTCRESCGKCTYCRLGTKRMLEILTRITQGKGQAGDIELLEELAVKIKEGSLCGLGQTAPNPVLSTLRYFREEYEAHILEHRCPAGQCTALLHYSINDRCVGCHVCAGVCPTKAITGERKQKHRIDPELCIRCGQCHAKCRFAAIDRC